MTRFSLTLFLLLCALPGVAAPHYKITPLPGMNIWGGNAFLNSRGMVACGDKVWQNGRTWTIHNPLTDAHYHETDASGVNDAGTVIGTFHGVEDGAWLVAYARVFVWRAGHVTLLPPTDKSDLSVPSADGIDNAGGVLVSVDRQSPDPHTVTYQYFLYHAGHYTLLRHGDTLRVNSLGQFVAVPYPKSVAPLSGEVYELHGVNGEGIIIGQYQGKLGIRACVWQHGRCQDIGPASEEASNAFAINNYGQVVGEFDTGQEEKSGANITRAFLWQNGRMTNLNKLVPARSGWVLTEADAINDRGQIVCAGNKGAYLLTPIMNRKRRP